jgi:hypothetical protein
MLGLADGKVDRYVLHQLASIESTVEEAYETFALNKGKAQEGIQLNCSSSPDDNLLCIIDPVGVLL